MNKPSPLKNKEGYVSSWDIRDKENVHPHGRTKVFEEEDVRLAVENYRTDLGNIFKKITKITRKYEGISDDDAEELTLLLLEISGKLDYWLGVDEK